MIKNKLFWTFILKIMSACIVMQTVQLIYFNTIYFKGDNWFWKKYCMHLANFFTEPTKLLLVKKTRVSSLQMIQHSEINIWFQELISIRKDLLKKYIAFLTRCRIRHGRFTHIYLVSNEEQLNVLRVIPSYSLKHILIFVRQSTMSTIYIRRRRNIEIVKRN